MPSGAPSSVKGKLEAACKSAVKEISKVAPGEKNEKKLAELLTEKVCKDVDQKILTLIAEELAKLGKKHSAKEPAYGMNQNKPQAQEVGETTARAQVQAKDDGGEHKVKTVGGCELTLKADGDKITVWDENGNGAAVTIADVEQSNGVIHVIDKVLLPKM